MMRLFLSIGLLGLPTLCALAQDVDVTAVVAGCRACHRGDLDLSASSAEQLQESMKSIAAGDAEHVVPIPSLNDDDLLAVAEMLQTATQ